MKRKGIAFLCTVYILCMIGTSLAMVVMKNADGVGPLAQQERLLVSYDEIVDSNGGVFQFNHRYSTFQFVNGYTSSRTKTLIEYKPGTPQDPFSTWKYHVTISYSFY